MRGYAASEKPSFHRRLLTLCLLFDKSFKFVSIVERPFRVFCIGFFPPEADEYKIIISLIYLVVRP